MKRKEVTEYYDNGQNKRSRTRDRRDESDQRYIGRRRDRTSEDRNHVGYNINYLKSLGAEINN